MAALHAAHDASREGDGSNFAWLIRLRWAAIVGQILTILAASRLVSAELPVLPLLGIVGIELVSNIGCWVWARRRTPAVTDTWLAGVMAVDVLLLTALLYFSGGPSNPFSFLYLVEIALAAIMLEERQTWALMLLALGCSGVLFLAHRPLGGSHADHMVLHLQGMWVAFAVAGSFIVYFLIRVRRALTRREAELLVARQRGAQQEKLASLATLAAGAAHELSTPLATIGLAARELQRRLEHSTEARFVDDARLICDQVQRCRHILERMATDAGESTGEGVSEVRVAELLAAARAGLPTTPAVSLHCDARVADQRLRLPLRAVAQALHGVLRNAQDASASDREVAIEVGDVDGFLEITVRDRGTGMPAEVVSRVGEPFFTTKEPGRGMGLGIFLSRTLLERLGGSLRLQSQPGVGTTATVRLPSSAQDARLDASS